jgi:hypothetical protein
MLDSWLLRFCILATGNFITWPKHVIAFFDSHKFSHAFQGKQLSQLLDEDPALMERRQQCAKRLELYKAARDEVDSVSWAR